MSDSIPRLENCGRYLACNNKGQWFYINHGGTWQTFQGFDAANAAEYKTRADEAEKFLAASVVAHEAMFDWVELELAQAGIDDGGIIAGAREAMVNVRAFLDGAKAKDA